jgi:subtilisin family serine protease
LRPWDSEPRDKYFDYWTTQFPYPTVFFAAGNNDITPNNDYAFAKGYNIRSVGNITLGDWPTNRCDDTMSVYNSWKNPSSDHADRENADIASPGDRHSLLGGSIGGTSTATPVTAGVAADLMSANSALKVWPEAIRAILFATANFQNADGQQYSRLLTAGTGVGDERILGIHDCATREPTTTARYRAHDYGSMSGSSFANGYFDRTWRSSGRPYGTHVRAGLVLDSNVTDENTDAMDLDLDLEIYDPNGQPRGHGQLVRQQLELVDFAPNLSGTTR